MRLSECFQVRRRSPLWLAHISFAAVEMASAPEGANEGLLLVVRVRDDADLQIQLRARLTLQTHEFL